MKFKELNIIEPVLRALEQKGYTEPTPIQAKAIPHILQKKDVLGCAQTGTGKTAAFAIPIIQLIHESVKNNTGRPKIRSLIVTPTRELAIQIDENIREYGKHTKLQHTVIFGGVSQGSQVAKLKRGVDILVATPGRLLDLLNQGHLTIANVELFVLDEADRMLDMGFINDIKKLLKLLPEKRQSLFFSATMPDNIVKLSNTILVNPVMVEVAVVSSTAETIQQHIFYTNRTDKGKLLLHILEDPRIEQVLVFSRTKHGCDRITRNLVKCNIKAEAIHGDKAQNSRQRALKKFKEGQCKVLVATDIAARGIDIDKLKYVINYDVPNLPETYVHRIGRSGRAGEEGVAISICEPEENEFVRGIERLIKKKIDVISDNPFPQTDKPMTNAEKKEWNKEKQRRKQEFFANKNKAGGGRNNARSKNSPKSKGGKSESNNRGSKSESKDKESYAVKSENSKRRNNNRKKPSNGNSSNESEKRGERTPSNKGPKPNNRSNKKKDNKSSSNTGSRKTRMLPNSLKEKYMWPLE